MPNRLTQKQTRFIEKYLETWNATRSAIDAGYSDRTACAVGAENLRKPSIRAELDLRIAEITTKNQDRIAYVINKLIDVVEKESNPHKNKALELLGKYHGMWTDRVDLTTNNESINQPVNVTFEVVKNASQD